MVIDKSGSMAGPKIAACKLAAIAAAKVLGPHDYIGVVAFDVDAYWIVPVQEVGDAASVVRQIERLGGDGGTNMKPGMMAGYEALAGECPGQAHDRPHRRPHGRERIPRAGRPHRAARTLP